MNRTKIATAALLLAGCAQHWPQTPDEFRRYAADSTFAKVETTEVNRPLRDVGKVFQAKAPKCLALTIEMREGARTVIRTLKPTVVVKGDKVELYVQQMYRGGGVIVPGQVPDGGAYFVVADGTAIDHARTRLTLYGPSIGDGGTVMKAIAGWATGEISGCPDMTK